MRRLAVIVALLFPPTVAFAQARSPAGETISPDLEPAVARGLAYLARQQQPDGSFQNREPAGDPKEPPRFTGPKVALTGLSLMAYLASGRMPDTGKHGLAVRNAVDYLVKACPADDGYFGKVDGSRMYGHAIATPALAEVYGMEADAAQRRGVHSALTRAVAVLLRAQATQKEEPHRGGWRYEIGSTDSDLSVSGWCILALRAAHNAGIEVPRESADRAAAFVLNCWRPDAKGFAYQPGGAATLTMTASAVLDLNLLDRGTTREARQAAAFLARTPVDDKTEYPYYARYYTTQAAFQAGGDVWPTVWNRTQADLLKLQHDQKDADGSWPPSRTANEPGQTYATAMSVLTLAVPLRLLPTYQR